MKFIPPITNSSSFYGMSVYHSSAPSLPINEVAWIACKLLGARQGVVFVDVQGAELREFYREARKKPPVPLLLLQPLSASSTRFPSEDSIIYVENGVYSVPVGALPLLSAFPWAPSHSITGVDKYGKEWEVCLERVAINLSPEIQCGGVAILLVLSNHRKYNWISFASELTRLIPAPSNLPEAVEIWRAGDFFSVHMLFGDVLLMDYFCFWKPQKDIVCGISPWPRQDTEREDMRKICYSAYLLSRWAKENTLIAYTDVVGGGRCFPIV